MGAFSDGECAVEITENVRGMDCFVLQSICNPANLHLMELLIMVDALRRSSASRITTVIPYYGYARQDRKVKPRVPPLFFQPNDISVLTISTSPRHQPRLKPGISFPATRNSAFPPANAADFTVE